MKISISETSIQALNKLVMATTDVKLLAAWLEEEKTGKRRASAMHRIYHRLNLLRAREDLAALSKLAKGR